MAHKSTHNKTRTNQIIQNQNTPHHFSRKIPTQNNFSTHHISTDGSNQGMKVGCAAIFQN